MMRGGADRKRGTHVYYRIREMRAWRETKGVESDTQDE